MPSAADVRWLAAAWAAIAVLTAVYVGWLGLSHPTIVALSFLLVVLMVSAVANRWVGIATSLLAFTSFNFFFLPPLATFAIDDPENWVALFTLLAVSVVASHLSTQARRRAREAVRLLEEREEEEVLRRSAELRSALLASLSHGLKTPLTAMTVAANNLKSSWLNEDQRREQTEVLISELDRLTRLFENVVDMARIETRAVAPEPEWVHPSEIIEAAARQTAGCLDRERLQVQVPPDDQFVRVDPRLASAALVHLLENAARYTPPSSPITVTATVGANAMEIVVRDHGRGIPTADVEKLFDGFYGGADSQRFGTGMGLAIAKGLVAAAGGRVSAANHPEGGAMMAITIPAVSRMARVVEESAP